MASRAYCEEYREEAPQLGVYKFALCFHRSGLQSVGPRVIFELGLAEI